MVQHSLVQNGALKYNGGRSSLSWWFSTPQGTYVLDWELAQFDSAVDDVFGFRALQDGLPEIDFLRQTRIPYRFSLALEPGAALAADPLQLPLASQSVDLVALAPVFEFPHTPHGVLREVERVLIPEGQVVISGFNSASLWRLRQVFSRKAGAPWDGRFIGLVRLKEWLKLLGLELNGGKFGCYAPPFSNPQWLRRFGFMEKMGPRWLWFAGAVSVGLAGRRARGMRVATPAWRGERARRRALAPMTQRSHKNHG